MPLQLHEENQEEEVFLQRQSRKKAEKENCLRKNQQKSMDFCTIL